jgi:acetoin utilization deacetylase AcuC-like enzyme
VAVALVLDEIFLDHRAPGGHPERPERLLAIRSALENSGLVAQAERLPVRKGREDEIERVHTGGYYDELCREVPGKSGYLDADTFFSPGTWEATLAAVGAAVDVTMASVEGRAKRGLALVRPPGHHAEPDRAMGFCLLNNAAIAARAARAAGLARVAVLDWDVHHGNGTQAAFWRDPTVMYLSTHQYPFYPGTGASDDIGEGEGTGTTVNAPLPEGSGDAEYAAAFDELLVPALRAFKPELLIISAGFDAFREDPLAGMTVTVDGYRRMAEVCRAAADELCEGRIVGVLEGGYHLSGLGQCATAFFEVLAAEATPTPAARDTDRILPGARRNLDATRKALSHSILAPR